MDSIHLNEKELKYFNEKYKDLNCVNDQKLHCTGCSKHIGSLPVNITEKNVHPLLKVLICPKCYEYYHNGDFVKDEDGSEIYCRWCGEGGDVYCCSKCSYVFCQSCIKRNLSSKEAEKIEESDDWSCLICEPSQISKLRVLTYALLAYAKKVIEESKGAYNEEVLRRMYNDNSKCCISLKRKRGRISEKLDKNKVVKLSTNSTQNASPASSTSASTTESSYSKLLKALTNSKGNTSNEEDEIVCTPDIFLDSGMQPNTETSLHSLVPSHLKIRLPVMYKVNDVEQSVTIENPPAKLRNRHDPPPPKTKPPIRLKVVRKDGKYDIPSNEVAETTHSLENENEPDPIEPLIEITEDESPAASTSVNGSKTPTRPTTPMTKALPDAPLNKIIVPTNTASKNKSSEPETEKVNGKLQPTVQQLKTCMLDMMKVSEYISKAVIKMQMGYNENTLENGRFYRDLKKCVDANIFFMKEIRNNLNLYPVHIERPPKNVYLSGVVSLEMEVDSGAEEDLETENAVASILDKTAEPSCSNEKLSNNVSNVTNKETEENQDKDIQDEIGNIASSVLDEIRSAILESKREFESRRGTTENNDYESLLNKSVLPKRSTNPASVAFESAFTQFLQNSPSTQIDDELYTSKEDEMSVDLEEIESTATSVDHLKEAMETAATKDDTRDSGVNSDKDSSKVEDNLKMSNLLKISRSADIETEMNEIQKFTENFLSQNDANEIKV